MDEDVFARITIDDMLTHYASTTLDRLESSRKLLSELKGEGLDRSTIVALLEVECSFLSFVMSIMRGYTKRE